MPDHALIVGCDAYPNLPGGNLRGAVADALDVRDWLLSRDGGAVGARELTLLVSCSAQGAQADPAVVAGPATRTAFAQAVSDLVAMQDARQSDRLFVYLAGHGCRTDPQNPVIAHDAFAFTDFAAIDPAGACVGVQDLVSRLRMSRFGIIVIFLDACRNFPFRETFDLSRIGRDPKPPAGRSYEPRVFLMHSTLPGRTSRGRPAQANGQVWRGDFTVALIDGLRGAGTAKAYDEKLERPYTVRWSSLARFVEAAVPDQAPRGPGEGDVVLASFPDGYFDLVRLTVKVDPSQFASAEGLRVRVRHTDPSAADDPEEQKPGPAPVDFRVPPRRQRVQAVAGDAWGRLFVDVYADDEVVVPVTPGGPATVRLEPDAVVFRDGTRVPAGAVDIRADDPAAVVRVHDVSGLVAQSGVGSATGRVAPGLYTAVLLGSDGRPHTQPVEVETLAETRMRMTAPGPLSPLFGGRRGELDLPRELAWASDAAALAWIATDYDAFTRSSPPAVVVALSGRRPPGTGIAEIGVGSGALALIDIVRGDRWWASLLIDQLLREVPSWVTIEVLGHRLTAPTLPEACTVVAVGPDRLAVGVYDHELLGSARRLALADRGQWLLDAGERDAAAAVLAASRQPQEIPLAGMPPDFPTGGIAASIIEDAARYRSAAHGLAASADPADAAGLLPAGPWAVFADRATERALPIGELPAGRPEP